VAIKSPSVIETSRIAFALVSGPRRVVLDEGSGASFARHFADDVPPIVGTGIELS
jgi:hypothetical protein